MNEFGNFCVYDLVLVVVVVLQGTFVAYLRHPRWKSFMLLLPFPFTIATLSVGKPVGAACLIGLALLIGFFQLVRLLYKKAGLNIIASIVIAASAYCVVGAAILPLLPDSASMFWLTFVLLIALGAVLMALTPHVQEPGHRTTLPVHIKIPLITIVVLLLVLLKNSLQGFMTVFPMVGVIAAYEARDCIATVCRQIPMIVITLGPMIATCFIAWNALGAGSLAIGWIVFLVMLALTRKMWMPAAISGGQGKCRLRDPGSATGDFPRL